jgi:fumarylacetoacetase
MSKTNNFTRCLFRDPKNALQPNYTHLPVGYHGRASSVVVSGTTIQRPWGQILPPGSQTPIHGPSKKLDIELELGCLLCTSNPMGTSLKLNGDAEEAVFGYVLMNDWSSRDIQRWEYVPLGPFNGKNFGTTISPWVVLPGALEPYRAKKLENETELLPYLQEKRQDTVYDISLSIDLTIGGDEDPATTTIAKVSSSNLLWSFPQMIAHHTMGGCPMNVGDLLGSGTISGTSKNELGSLLEMGKDGKEGEELMLAGMNTRKWLLDGDVVTFRGKAGEGVGFGECTGKVVGTQKY